MFGYPDNFGKMLFPDCVNAVVKFMFQGSFSIADNTS